MTNLAWYICIAVISVGIAACTIYIKRDSYKVSTFLLFYLFASSMTWIGEFIVLGLFDSYAYKTGLFTDAWAQNLLGHLLLNTTMYPTAAVVMVACSLRYRWISVIVVIFVAIEYFFMKLGMYEQHWWRFYMSVIIVITFALISGKWFSKMNHDGSGSTRTIILYFVAMIIIHTPAPVLLLLGVQHYQSGFIDSFFDNMYRTSIFIIFVYHLIEAFILVVCACILKNRYWKLVALLVSPVALIIFAKAGVLIMEGGWRLSYTIIIYEIFIVIFLLIEKYTLKPDKNLMPKKAGRF